MSEEKLLNKLRTHLASLPNEKVRQKKKQRWCKCGTELEPIRRPKPRTTYFFGKNRACDGCAIMGFMSPQLKIIFKGVKNEWDNKRAGRS